MTFKALSMLTLGLFVAACGVDTLGPEHPVDRLDYPVAVTADPSGEVLWVTSGDFDLAYEGGAVMGIDVRTHAFIPGAAAEVGAFPGAFRILSRDGKSAHGYVLSRSTDEIYHLRIGWDAQDRPSLDCDEGEVTETGLVRCTRTGTSERTVGDVTLTLGSDPFGALIHTARAAGGPDLLLTTAMGDGKLSTFELGDDGVPTLVGGMTLSAGLFALARDPHTDRIYSTSKSVNTLQILEVAETATADVENPYVEKVDDLVLPAAVAADHARGLAFNGDGSRLLVLHRSPNAVVIVDTHMNGIGAGEDQVIAKVPVGSSPGEILVTPPYGGLPELAYVSCFGSDRVDVIDPALGLVVATIRTGRGPFGLAFIHNPSAGIRRLYVVNFHAQSLGVIELDPASPYFHTEVAEIR